MLQNLSSASVVIGALRVIFLFSLPFGLCVLRSLFIVIIELLIDICVVHYYYFIMFILPRYKMIQEVPKIVCVCGSFINVHT